MEGEGPASSCSVGFFLEMMLLALAVPMLEGFEVNCSSRVKHCIAVFFIMLLFGDGNLLGTPGLSMHIPILVFVAPGITAESFWEDKSLLVGFCFTLISLDCLFHLPEPLW